MDYLQCGNLPYPAWKKRITAHILSYRCIHRYLVCRLKRLEARDFSHVRFTEHCTLGILKFIQNQVKWELEKGKENRSRETMFTKYKNSVIIRLLFY